MIKNVLAILIIGLIIAGCSRDENNERKALSHCADIKYIKNLNAYPQIIVNNTKRSEIIQALQTRGEAITEWEKENNTANDLMGLTKAKDKFADLSDPINFKLFRLFNKIIAEASNVQALNQKTMDWGIEQKKNEFFYYAEFHLECWNEYKRDNGYYSKEFIDKYLEWQKQDVSNLSKQSHDFLDEMLQLTRFTSYSKGFSDHYELLISILAPKN